MQCLLVRPYLCICIYVRGRILWYYIESSCIELGLIGLIGLEQFVILTHVLGSCMNNGGILECVMLLSLVYWGLTPQQQPYCRVISRR